MRLLSDIADLLLPRVCAGCGIETVSLCGDCVEALNQPVQQVQPRFGQLSVNGAGTYEGVLRRVLLAYKEHSRKDMTAVLGLLLARAVVEACAAAIVDGSPVVLVPVPSAPASIRRRGGNHIAAIAESTAQLLRADGMQAGCADVLMVTHHRDQVGRGIRDRRSNVKGTHAVSRRHVELVAEWDRRARVVVVDDISTTGATGAETVRALTAAGCHPVGLAVVAIAPGGTRANTSQESS